MRGTGGTDCDFCDVAAFRDSELFVQTDHSFFASTSVQSDSVLPAARRALAPQAGREPPS
jgi:hypothetical protein